MKPRDTLIIAVRIKKDLLPLIDEKVARSKKPSRNSWINWRLLGGLREHRRKQ